MFLRRSQNENGAKSGPRVGKRGEINQEERVILEQRYRSYLGHLRMIFDLSFCEREAARRREAEKVAIHPGSLRITAYLFARGKQSVVHTQNYFPRNLPEIANVELAL